MKTKRMILLVIITCFVGGIFMVTINFNTINSTSKWKTYTDDNLGFMIDYPANLLIEKEASTVSFLKRTANSDAENGLISVIKNQNSNRALNVDSLVRETTNDSRERAMLLDGTEAVVTHLNDNPDSKTAYVLKDNFLFIIITYGVNHERVWNSFKFLK